jgi:hypothetical protein
MNILRLRHHTLADHDEAEHQQGYELSVAGFR